MGNITGRLTVYFQDPFWVGVFEREEGGKLSASKVTFGSEPKAQDVYAFVSKNYYTLKFSAAVTFAVRKTPKNPKRAQREARRCMESTGTGTRSQQALKLQQEENKQERKDRSRHMKEEEARRRFELRQQKKKEKHRGH